MSGKNSAIHTSNNTDSKPRIGVMRNLNPISDDDIARWRGNLGWIAWGVSMSWIVMDKLL